jgi:hypothetical protein
MLLLKAPTMGEWVIWVLRGMGALAITVGFLTVLSVIGDWWDKWKEPR